MRKLKVAACVAVCLGMLMLLAWLGPEVLEPVTRFEYYRGEM